MVSLQFLNMKTNIDNLNVTDVRAEYQPHAGQSVNFEQFMGK